MAKQDSRDRRIEKLEIILDVAKTMAQQHDLNKLLEIVVDHARKVAHAERATIFLLDKATNELWSKVAHGSGEIRFPADKGIAGSVVKSRESLNIPDAYADPRFNSDVDKASGFRTRCILSVPMLSTKDEVVGVMQVLNKIPRDPSQKDQACFDAEDDEMLFALGGQAASAIENALLYDEINRLFEGFIKASVVAIESRDPTTSGHSERVAVLTCGLAETIDRLDKGPFAAIRFDYDQMKEIRYASLLHDFGKVGVRENVLVKAEKLFPEELSLLLSRFDFIRRTAEKEAAERKIAALQSGSGDRKAMVAQIDADLTQILAELDDMKTFVLACNMPTVLEKGGFDRLHHIAAKKFNSFDGAQPYLTDSELLSLSVTRGSLTKKDRLEIESHVTHTYRFLSTIPWTKTLKQVPNIAYGHHEKLDGKGYPRHMGAAQIPVQTRMMTISDIYDALTAMDRPYKKAVPVNKALDILGFEAKAGKVDTELLKHFIDAKIYEKIVKP